MSIYIRKEDGREYEVITIALARSAESNGFWTQRMIVHKPVSDHNYPSYVMTEEEFRKSFKKKE